MARSTPGMSCFLALRSTKNSRLRKALTDGAQKAGFDSLSATADKSVRPAFANEILPSLIARSDCVIAEMGDSEPNTYFELGLARAMGKGIFLLAETGQVAELPLELGQFPIIRYVDSPNGLLQLTREVRSLLKDFAESPHAQPALLGPRAAAPYFIDWNSIPPREAENLCQELLSQLGFRSLEWGRDSREVDIVAELPKRDPDGFEYREVWLVSVASTGSHKMVEMLSQDPEYLLQRLVRYSERFEHISPRYNEIPITILLILMRDETGQREIEGWRDQLDVRLGRKLPFRRNVRIRIWDQHYLTSLVQRFPSIGYKYFSDEGRIRSKTRKSYEQLYSENSAVNTRLASLNAQLEQERNARVRAERDAVWKDISFTAAHKIGNPIFAIETDLDPLVKRITENRLAEASKVVSNMRASVEKAKAFVEQFKSLAKAQENHPLQTLLKPMLEDSCKLAKSQGVSCTIDCPRDLSVWADPDRLPECFDELVANALHWFNKENKTLAFSVVSPAPKPVPKFLDSSRDYVIVYVRDNGVGVPPSDKAQIFNAFFTRRDHGTGLGLAIVRRIVEGHGGAIAEIGTPGDGAVFELYLPVNPAPDTQLAVSSDSAKIAKKRKESHG